MVLAYTQDEKLRYDVTGVGLGEGLYCCTRWELEQLKKEIEEVLNERAR